jgi:excinuclease ABC subunit C
LESRLIKKHLPRYNVIWRDGKSALYIKIPVADIYPIISLCRKENDGSSLYFGPFSGVRITQTILREIRSVIPFCTQRFPASRPCFYSKIGLCDPCPSGIIRAPAHTQSLLRAQYQYNIRMVISILRGNSERVLLRLRQRMRDASTKHEFETALALRNRIFRFQKLITERIDFGNPHSDTLYRADPEAGARILHAFLIQFFPTIAPLSRIECLDISHTSQREIVGGIVVANSGIIDKSQYKKFKIKNPSVHSDFDAIEEVVRRRFSEKHIASWGLPTLFIIDGGTPQVRRVTEIFRDLSLLIPVVGIAKNPDRLVLGIDSFPTMRMQSSNPAFNLIRNLRDESHRFSKKYHTSLRDSNT